MKITQMLLSPNKYSRPQIPLADVKKIAVHYVGNPNSTALNNRNYFESLKNKGIYASSHYIIGLEGKIICCVPENEIAYCTNQANSYSISIECCHPKADGRFNKETTDSLLELCAYLCRKYGLGAEDVIRHYDVTKKKCPLYWVTNPEEFAAFKNRLRLELEGGEDMTYNQAVGILIEKGVINSPEYWNNAVKCVKHLDSLIINMAEKLC